MNARVAAAQLRASITAFLNARSGTQFTVVEISEAISESINAVGRAAKKMAADGLIVDAGTYRGKHLYMSAESSGEPADKKVRGFPALKEVELVVGGIQVLVGRNPKTGRLRIVLEEV